MKLTVYNVVVTPTHICGALVAGNVTSRYVHECKHVLRLHILTLLPAGVMQR